MFKKSIKISKELYQDIEQYMGNTEHESVDDFVEKFLGDKIRPELEKIKVEERLKGLGYIE